MNTTTDNKQALRDFVAGLGLDYQAVFVPTTQGPEVEHPQLHWSITLSKGRQRFTTTYSQGMGHVVGYRQFHKTPYHKRIAEEGYRKTCETGKLWKYMEGMDWWTPKDVQPAPELLDVLYCLVLDADVLEHSGLESWASDLGYDTDSRKAEAIWKTCIEQSLALKGLIGSTNLEALRELYQDY